MFNNVLELQHRLSYTGTGLKTFFETPQATALCDLTFDDLCGGHHANTFDVFGEPVELLITSAQTNGAFAIGRQTCAPGSGVPPHLHHHEDEAFSVVTGRFEFFDGNTNTWTEIPEHGVIFAPRGNVHCFRNCGDERGTIQFISSGSAFDIFLEGLSKYQMPGDMQAMVDYSATFGIFYPTLPPPTSTEKKELTTA
jgi:mannose-6-phosphate isomerase-like protein (cupin superfamily)